MLLAHAYYSENALLGMTEKEHWQNPEENADFCQTDFW